MTSLRTLGCVVVLMVSSCATTQPAEQPAAVVKAPEPTATFKAPPEGDLGATLISGTAEAFTTRCDEELRRGRELVVSLRAAKDRGEIVELMNELDRRLSTIGGRAGIASSLQPDEKFRSAAEKCESMISGFAVEASQDRGVYDALQRIDTSGFDAPGKFWYEKQLKSFRRSGVDRDEATRKKVATLSAEITDLVQTFDRNIRDSTPTLAFTPKELDGAPADWLKTHRVVDGKIVISTDPPDVGPVSLYVKSPKTREALFKLFHNRAAPANQPVLEALIAKRAELAKTLGFASYAAYDLELRMAKTAEGAAAFIEKGRLATEARAKVDYAQLLSRKQKDVKGAKQLDPWDFRYYENLVLNEKYKLDTQKLREYLEYDHVRDGVIDTTSRLFGIRYQRVTDAKVWHSEVETYDVFEGDTKLGRIHLDMHPREGKYKHGAQAELTLGQGGKVLPEAVLMCNFGRPGELLEFTDVTTFFHEFGHLLHSIFGSRGNYASNNGVRTEADFVEAPSMFLQEWPLDASTVQGFAKHFKTNEPIPAALVSQMTAAQEFGKGLYIRRQLMLASVSLEYFSRAPGFDTTAVVKEIQEKFDPVQREAVDGTRFELSFGHLGGYGAAYYTYMWSLVIAKDLLSPFRATSMSNTETAAKYRRDILDRGGERPAAESVAAFLGRPYSFDAFEKYLNEGLKRSPPAPLPKRP